MILNRFDANTLYDAIAAVVNSAHHRHRPIFIVPRGLNRVEAANYIGVSPSKFDELVRDGRMPKPVKIDGRKVWDRSALDAAFEALKSEPDANPWDDEPTGVV